MITMNYKRVVALIISLLGVCFIVVNFPNEKLQEIVVGGLILTILIPFFVEKYGGNKSDRMLGLISSSIIAICVLGALSIKMPENKVVRMSGIAFYSPKPNGPYLYKSFKFPHEFYSRQWKFGIMLNAYHEKHLNESLPDDFYVSWIARTVMVELSKVYCGSSYKYNFFNLGEVRGPAVDELEVKVSSQSWKAVSGFQNNTFASINAPVAFDRMVFPKGGAIRCDVHGREAKIELKGRYVTVAIEIMLSGVDNIRAPYPEIFLDNKEFNKSGQSSVLYEMTVKYKFSKRHFNLVSPQINKEREWADQIVELLQNKYDDHLFFNALTERIKVRAAIEVINKGNKIKSVDAPLLFEDYLY